MSLLQGEVMPRSLAKHVLRQRIYSCCLDFFCADKIYPCRSGQALKEDVQVGPRVLLGVSNDDGVQVMLKFWTAIWRDKNYIRNCGNLAGQ